jgi:hypothetical protein
LFSGRPEVRLLPLLVDPLDALLLPLELLRPLPPPDRFSRPDPPLFLLELLPPLLFELLLLPLLLELLLPLLLELLLPLLLELLLLLLLELLLLLLLLELLSAPPCLPCARVFDKLATATHSNAATMNAS